MDNLVCLWDMSPLNDERMSPDTNTQQHSQLWVYIEHQPTTLVLSCSKLYSCIVKNLLLYCIYLQSAPFMFVKISGELYIFLILQEFWTEPIYYPFITVIAGNSLFSNSFIYFSVPISCIQSFPTKASPVMCLHFTRRNLLLAAGAFQSPWEKQLCLK